ncbi:TIGR03086 family metal-binding protein [Microlunatus speluncae]|uniref:TIGR03086 family metal-binding protein n=1 Tax=Microlunatus speluncae TaxID=2594267 RepID=UPI0012666DB5|nr:TIGR03086 family metal-binding protein [Microlunatus speluncae]
MPTDTSIVQHHATASRQIIDIARQATPEQLNRSTPCGDWDLRQLFDHLTTENLGFAAAAQGHGSDPDVWVGDLERADPVADYVRATEALVVTFAEPDVLDRSFALPVLTKDREFAGSQAVMMHLVDTVVHAWDLARALDLPITFDAEITQPVLAMSEQIPDDESRTGPGAFFGPAVAQPADGTELDRIVALLGRSPTWPN